MVVTDVVGINDNGDAIEIVQFSLVNVLLFTVRVTIRECCQTLPHNKVKNYLSKIGFVDSKWCNLNAKGSCIPWSVHFWGLL